MNVFNGIHRGHSCYVVKHVLYNRLIKNKLKVNIFEI